ncbi:hypothetical protein [Streptomyces sp. NPDC002889]|uniref:hypothetical protein n=1 Tax=Streptomyces sp. NPDC002889 TaxID=3364669 RepID=UPI00367692A1
MEFADREISESALVGAVYRFEQPQQSGQTTQVARPLATTSTVPKLAVTASTARSSIPSNTSESQNDTSACMTSTVTGRYHK